MERPAELKETRPQAGVLAYRFEGETPQYLLVTSRRSRRWVFPKGSLMRGKTAWQSAAQEAYEEAGIRGLIEIAPIGRFAGTLNDEQGTEVAVDLFPLEVVNAYDDWPEQHQRERSWMTLEELREVVTEDDRLSIVADFDAALRAGRKKRRVKKTKPQRPG